jgi:hypothetical protein
LLDDFVVTQTMDCSTSLTANSGYSPVDASYDALISFNDQTTSWEVLASYETLITNADSTGCPATCVLKDAGCSVDFTGTATMDVSSPFSVTAVSTD